MEVLILLTLVAGAYSLGYHEDIGIPKYVRLISDILNSKTIGEFPTRDADFTYMAGILVTLRTGQLSLCGGTILSETRVLTAAQCWYDGYNQGKKIEVWYGSTLLFLGNSRDVTAVDMHTKFDPLRNLNDLALLTVSDKIYFDTWVQPAVLPTRNDEDRIFFDVEPHIVGFGKNGGWNPIGTQQVRHSVSVLVVFHSVCYETFGVYKDDTMLCTEGNDRYACMGDVGGPLVIKNYFNGTDLLIGVTSMISPDNCENGFVTGYTRVASHLDWILSNLDPTPEPTDLIPEWRPVDEEQRPYLNIDNPITLESGEGGNRYEGNDEGGNRDEGNDEGGNKYEGNDEGGNRYEGNDEGGNRYEGNDEGGNRYEGIDEGGNGDEGNYEGGNRDEGNDEGGNRDERNDEGGNRDEGNDEGGNRYEGNDEGGNRYEGNDEGGNRDERNDEGGNRYEGNDGGGNRYEGNEEGGNRDEGNDEGGNRYEGNDEGGNRYEGNEEGGNRDEGNDEGRNRDEGNDEGGNRDGGNDEGGNGGNSVVPFTLLTSIALIVNLFR